VIVPDKEQFLRQAEKGTLVPVFREYHADLETPVSAYLKISGRFPTDHFLLESVEGGEKWARYSFIGFDPRLLFRADAKGVSVRQGGNTRNVPAMGDPLDALERILKEIRYRPAPGLPRLSGGAVGYIGYDYVRYLEKVGGDRPLTDAPDAMFLFPSRLVIFDNVRHTILIVTHGSVQAPSTSGRSMPSRKFAESFACRWKDPKSRTATMEGRNPRSKCPEGSSSTRWGRPRSTYGTATSSRRFSPIGRPSAHAGLPPRCTASFAPSIPPPTCTC